MASEASSGGLNFDNQLVNDEGFGFRLTRGWSRVLIGKCTALWSEPERQ